MDNSEIFLLIDYIKAEQDDLAFKYNNNLDRLSHLEGLVYDMKLVRELTNPKHSIVNSLEIDDGQA